MDEVGAFEAKTHLPRLLRQVAKGSSYVITQRGVPVARLVPVGDESQAQTQAAIARIRARRASKPAVSALELRSMIDEGRRR